MRFARLGDRVIAFSRIEKYVGGEGKQPRVKVFTRDEPIACVPPSDFQDMVQSGTIQRLDLPHELRSWAERLSNRIGDTYTPQKALRILQGIIQDHPTTLTAEVVAHE
jgi:hypothetical protein